MNYLELVNFVIQETANEQNTLDTLSWSSSEAGRRLYPRIKRYVSQAWEEIQQSRDQWEFMTKTTHLTVYPRIKYVSGSAAATPISGDIFVGDDSGFTFVVNSVTVGSGSFATNDAAGFVDAKNITVGGRVFLGEVFRNAANTKTLVYDGVGYYDFIGELGDVAAIDWTTFVITDPILSISPIVHIPWEPWAFNNQEYTYGGITAPSSIAQTPEGEVAFYPIPQRPFTVMFTYSRQPQILTDYNDIPEGLPTWYHKWIGWEAVMRLASYDKNQQLLSHAAKPAMFYRKRAEANLMPLVKYSVSAYDE